MMLEYTLTKPSTANFTPASLMNEIAKAGRCECFNGFWGGCVMMVNDTAYTFDHWHIEPRTDRPGWDSITVYLAPRGSLLRLEHEQSARRANGAEV